MAGAAIKPWHMWGSSELVDVIGGPPGAIPTGKQQLAQINYGRPDSWRFLLQMQITDVSGSIGAANFDLEWILTVGLGRTIIKMDPFSTFTVIPADFTVGKTITVGSVELPSENAARVEANVINEFPAESIQIDTRFSFDQANTARAHVRLTALFAPVTHIRPEWHLHEFPGKENTGR